MKQPIDLHKIGEKLEFNDARERTNGQRSEVISGRMVAMVNGKEVVANAGETIIVLPGESHDK